MQTEGGDLLPDLARARRYRRIKLAFYGAGLVSSVTVNGWLALSGASARWRRAVGRRVPDQRWADSGFLMITQGAGWLAGLPLSFAGGHLVERAFGLTRRTARAWLGEQLKGLVLSMAFNVPLTTAAFAVIRRRPNDWWLVLSGVSVPVAVLAIRLGPVLIAPLFNRFEPIDDPELRSRITTLGERAGVRIVEVYRMDMSQQTEKANAFFTGIGDSKRIVLGDTLMDRFETDEIEGIVAHELGHQVHSDVWRLVALFGGGGFAVAYALQRLIPKVIGATRKRTGVARADEVAALPIYALLMTGIGIAMQPMQAAMSRRMERRTDRFALELTWNADAYARAMERLTVQNLDDPDPPRWLVWFAYTHPPTVERIAAARDFGGQG